MAGPVPQPAFEHTRPERLAQDLLRRAGVSFRTHAKELPGNPDIVVDATKVAVFVHGCFWHNHGCEFTSLPAPDSEHAESIRQKQLRDARNPSLLLELGWMTCVVWECELERTPVLALDRMLAAIGSAAQKTAREYGGTRTLGYTYRAPVTLWLLFGFLGLLVLTAAGISTLRIRDQGAADAELSAATSRLRELREAIDAAATEEAAARDRAGVAEKDLAPLEARLDTLRSQEDALQRQTGTLNVQLGEAQAELSRLREQITSANTDLIAAQASLSNATREADAAIQQATLERSTLQALSAQRADTETSLRELLGQTNRYRADAATAFLELSTAREDLASAQAEYSSLIASLADARSVITEGQTARRTLAQLQQTLAESQSQQEQLDRSLRSLQQTLAAEDAALSDLRATAAALRQAVSASKADLETLTAEQQRLSASLTLDRDTIQRSTQDRLKAEQAALLAQSALREAERALAETRQSRETVRLELETLSATRQRQQQAIDSLNVELAALSTSTANARAASTRREADQAVANQLDELAAVFSQLIGRLRDAAATPPPPTVPVPSQPEPPASETND